MNEALMTLIRGTNDENNPFFGEDLLSDYYGHDGRNLQIRPYATPTAGGAAIAGNGFARIPIGYIGGKRPPEIPALDDAFAGRLITPTEGPLAGKTYRIFRSQHLPDSGFDNLWIDLSGTEVSANANPGAVRSLFYKPGTTQGYTLVLNGIPQNASGVGFDDTNPANAASTTGRDQIFFTGANGATRTAAGFDLPEALQPNHFGRQYNKKDATTGDFDEEYDAPDFNNWWLSYRRPDGKSVIPSFHRPAVLNYILNQNAALQNRSDLMVSLQRGTFRPLPLAPNTLPGNSKSVNQRFTGGSSHFALRTPGPNTNDTYLNQLLVALIDPMDDNWDVDNDGDGTSDSIWVDLGLPTFTSKEGKLLRPLVAPMIEDLSGRLNLNAHGNYSINSFVSTPGLPGNNAIAEWGNNAGVANNLFRGNGWGPAEIALPSTANGVNSKSFIELIAKRYQYGPQERQTGNPEVGINGRDALNTLTSGFQPPQHTAMGGFGYGSNLGGNQAVALGKSGHLLSAGSVATGNADNNALNTPYEQDPSGLLSGDSQFQIGELESLLREKDFDSELLPTRLRDSLKDIVNQNAYRNAFTTRSISSDNPPLSLVDLINRINPNLKNDVNYQQTIDALVAPELRLGRKIDVNRAIGNLVDDNNNLIIDEPNEVANEGTAFALAGNAAGTIPTDFQDRVPNYRWDEQTQNNEIPVDGRQLLARHLYVLVMALSRSLDTPGSDATLPTLSSFPNGSIDAKRYKARRLAQWAVNVVDYRDPDSIMTRFVFDENPFDGWNPVNQNGQPDTPATPADERNVVWGVEAPQLLFSEGMAFHDTRVRDTDKDSTGEFKKDNNANQADDTTDQVRIPQGSLFMELYCPHPTFQNNNDSKTKPSFPAEFYTAVNGSYKLQLGKTAPSGPNGTKAPVWRVAISERHDERLANQNISEDSSRLKLRDSLPDTAGFEPSQRDEIRDEPWQGNNGADIGLDRFILFKEFDDPNNNNQAGDSVPQIAGMNTTNVFFPQQGKNPDSNLNAGQFLVLCPRDVTYFGSRFAPSVGNGNSNAGGNGNGNAFGLRNRIQPNGPSDQRFTTTSNQGFMQYGFDGPDADDTPDTLTPSLAAAEPPAPGTNYGAQAKTLIISTPRPAGWAGSIFQNGVVGLNISEPLPRSANYYPQPTTKYFGNQVFAGNRSYTLTDAYTNLEDGTGQARNRPVDGNHQLIPPSQDAAGEPFLGTVFDYRSAFLQRLADPTKPFNAITNPYRTVDWLPLDLTVFSGEEQEKFVTGNGPDRDYARYSRQRNGMIRRWTPGTPPTYVNPNTPENTLFSHETSDPSGTTSTLEDGGLNGGSGHFFQFTNNQNLQSSFSFLNTAEPNVNNGFQGFSTPLGNSANGMDANLPNVSYALHPWLNRPFASHLELMMVPACSSGRLFEEFSVNQTAQGDPDVYPNANTNANTEVSLAHAPFRHLLNFFHSFHDTNATNAPKPEFARLFDFVHTMPRFRGEVKFLSPNRLAPMSTLAVNRVATDPQASPSPWKNLMRPPFNIAYDNKRQGMINLNTITSPAVWVGLMQGHMTDDDYVFSTTQGQGDLSFRRFLKNRRGYTTEAKSTITDPQGNTFNYDAANLNSDYPTEFAGVYRSYSRGSKGIIDNLARSSVNGGLLRDSSHAGTIPSPQPDDQVPFYVRSATQAPTAANAPEMNRLRNPYMRYQTVMRMPNLVSNNSQVFLVRMTIGFFEVDSATQSLGREYNAETGNSERFHGTFVIDRSIPVGFSPGNDLNARDVVVFESYAQ
ncbi:hypothetical protein OAE54_00295 [bacterium]|nr:hypothetical protein [bacterium]